MALALRYIGRAISIHAAREGGDIELLALSKMLDISIHAAREGGDPRVRQAADIYMRFQSTPPVKAATLLLWICTQARRISIHAAREGGDELFHDIYNAGAISIHAAREGGDTE